MLIKKKNTKAQILELRELFPVYVSDIVSLNNAYRMMLDVGTLTNKVIPAEELVEMIKSSFASLKKEINKPYAKAAYLIWNKPIMAAGGNTIINTLLKQAGFWNAFSHLQRYPEISEKDLADTNPEILLLSSEPFPFKKKHIAQFKKIVPEANIMLVDGEMFSWYGSHLLCATDYFIKLRSTIKKAL